MIKLKLEEGTEYGYAEVMQSLAGGSAQCYLPYKGQQVFAALLTPQLNPDAPNVILVGSKDSVAHAGAIFSRQTTAVPTFVKKATNRWEYRGMYVVAEVISKTEAAAIAKRAIPPRTDVAFALRLQKVKGDPIEKVFMEGSCSQVTKNVYERDGEARAKCIQHHGRRCCVCDLDFGEEYGQRGEGFIHVHHLEQLSARNGPSVTDPITGLRPVCANCHAMLHAGGKLIMPEELRETYWSEASNSAREVRLQLGLR